MFSHAQLHLWFSVRLFGVIFIFTLADAISKVVKKAKPRSSGWGAEGPTGEIFVFEGFQNDGGGGPEGFCCYRTLHLFELIYGYSPHLRNHAHYKHIEDGSLNFTPQKVNIGMPPAPFWVSSFNTG